ncbi:hypothetical protein D1007_13995 [Hordeum vulgare]|nr:hypothetical protein D1007_13995 [Hordeum vulgare]
MAIVILNCVLVFLTNATSKIDRAITLYLSRKKIRVLCCNRRSVKVYHGMVTEDAHLLERLVMVDEQGPTRISVIYAPKLTVLAYSPIKFSELVIGYITVQKIIPSNLTPLLSIAKVLALESTGPGLDEVARFLKCFPCVLKLYIEIRPGQAADNVTQYYGILIEFLDFHLYEITLNSYQGTLPEIKLARFFVTKANVLKVMRLGVHIVHTNKWFGDQRLRLQQNRKGCAKAELHFGSLGYKVIGTRCDMPLHDL